MTTNQPKIEVSFLTPAARDLLPRKETVWEQLIIVSTGDVVVGDEHHLDIATVFLHSSVNTL